MIDSRISARGENSSGESGSPPPRGEYPRPQFVRDRWLNLNGNWDFRFDDNDQGVAQQWFKGSTLDQTILVPFPYQSPLSGVNDQTVHEIVWYARNFQIPTAWTNDDLLLHFGAVDYAATVWVNGEEVGHNRGGHVPFQFDIAPYVTSGTNRLTVRVEDRQDPRQPRGKQSSTGQPHNIDYFCTTGIWQTVWIEPVPSIRIDELRITPNAERNFVEVIAYLHAPAAPWRIEAELTYHGAMIARTEDRLAIATAHLTFTVPYAKLWSPETPHLYDLRIRLYRDDDMLDEVLSYVGIRSLRIERGRFVLNGQTTYLKLALDQGYWPEGLLAAPSDEALQTDIGWAKRFGFNGVRKHQKIEDPRWLYWCDRLGLLVWEEMPNAREWSPIGEENLAAEWKRAVQRDFNHPCIIAWVPVNESMGFPKLGEQHPGQYAFIERMVADTRRLDSTRPIIDNDGWEHTDITDICAIHDYTPTGEGIRERYQAFESRRELPPRVWIGDKPLFTRGSLFRGQPVVLSEVGGFLMIPLDIPAQQRDILYQFYGSATTTDELWKKYQGLMEGIASLSSVAGFCYTQLTDIEQEINGLLTYDRKPKIDPESLAGLHSRLFPA